MLLDGRDGAAGRGGLEHGSLVEGLDRGHVEDAATDSARSQSSGGVDRVVQGLPAGYEGAVASLGQDIGLA